MKVNLERIEMGRIIRLGNHRIICGDCTNPQIIAKLLNGVCVNCWLTDEPYGVAAVESKKSLLGNSKHRKIENDQTQSESEHKAFVKSWITPVLPYLEKKNSIYFFNSDKMIFALHEAMLGCDIKFAQLLIWVKSQPVIG